MLSIKKLTTIFCVVKGNFSGCGNSWRKDPSPVLELLFTKLLNRGGKGVVSLDKSSLSPPERP
jgi:hypothetical protein